MTPAMTPAMTPERYQRISELFDEALELAAEERAAFLRRACGADAELFAEVERLLANQAESGEFLSRPALNVAAALLAQNQSPSEPGKQIKHYELLSPLGAGGMGEVWLARDSQLERKVALKFLPEHFTRSQTHVRRFAQEARAASALSHPNIITMHEIGAA
jgi:eukaryotic-like serine/threonine-protein kinase